MPESQTAEPESTAHPAQPNAAVDLSDVEGGNLNVRDVTAKEVGVRVQRTRIAGDINIQGVQVGAGPAAPPAPPAPAQERPCLLVLTANPGDQERLALDEEFRAIDAALRRSPNTPRLDLRRHGALRIGDLQELLLRYRPAIVHFCGHGDHTGAIVLQDEDGQSRPVPPAGLAQLFGLFKQHVRLVVLNACWSAEQAEAIAGQVEVVIGMADVFSDDAAVDFAAALYGAIGYGSNIQAAFALACNQVDLAGRAEAHIPQMLTARVDAANVLFG